MKFKFLKSTYQYKPKLASTLFFIFALLILVGLSLWQIKRLHWKEALISERIERFESQSTLLNELDKPEDKEFRKVVIKAKYLKEHLMFMPALSKNGNNGYHIILPVELFNGEKIIFDSGWIPLRLKEKDFFNDKKFKTIEAVIRLPGRKGKFQPDNDIKNNFWFFVDTHQMSRFTSIDLNKNFYLEAVNNGESGYPLGKQTRIYIRNNHLQYAITWFLIACGLVGVYIAANIKKINKN